MQVSVRKSSSVVLGVKHGRLRSWNNIHYVEVGLFGKVLRKITGLKEVEKMSHLASVGSRSPSFPSRSSSQLLPGLHQSLLPAGLHFSASDGILLLLIHSLHVLEPIFLGGGGVFFCLMNYVWSSLVHSMSGLRNFTFAALNLGLYLCLRNQFSLTYVTTASGVILCSMN
jgi:hypothetical protein